MKRPAYFDTTIFVEIGAKRSRHKAKIRELLKELQEVKVRIYTSMITVQELGVAAYRAGTVARDTYADVSAFARVYTVTKEVALTAAKYEAALKDLAEAELSKRDSRKPETEEQKLERICENRRRKWDCFHIATAQQLGCTEVYSLDEKLQKRADQLSIKGMKIISPLTSVKTIKGPLVDGAGHIKT